MIATDCWCSGRGECVCLVDGDLMTCLVHATEEQLARTRDDHAHADQLLACAACPTLLRWEPGRELPALFCQPCKEALF